MLRKLLTLGIVSALLLTPLVAIAQEPGSGRMIRIGRMGYVETMAPLNPLRHAQGTTRTAAWEALDLMFPRLVGSSPITQYYARAGEEGVFNALATDWMISENGRVYTFVLRQDAVWSDGTPITATDIKFTYDALMSRQIDSLSSDNMVYDPDTNPTGIQSVKIVDDYAIQIEFGEASCNVLSLAYQYIVPAHAFGYSGQADFDFSIMIDHPFDSSPSIVYGPFGFDELRPGEGLFLKRVDTWAEDVVIPEGVAFLDVESYEAEFDKFLAGDLDIYNVMNKGQQEVWPEQWAVLQAATGIQLFSLPGRGYDYIGLNFADPADPRPGLDDNGELIDQGHHPILGDVRVRRALQYATNVPAIIEATGNAATPLASFTPPATWAASPELQPVPYDPVLAAHLLDEAGWPLGPDGVRVCENCQYALNGTPLVLDFLGILGYPRTDPVQRAVKEQWKELGIEVNLQMVSGMEWLNGMNSQTFDIVLGVWNLGFLDDADQASIIYPAADVPDGDFGSFNVGSYYNPQVNRLNEQAVRLPGCDLAERIALIQERDRILQDEQLYIWLYVRNQVTAAHDYVQGFDPQPNMPLWNLHTWYIAP